MRSAPWTSAAFLVVPGHHYFTLAVISGCPQFWAQPAQRRAARSQHHAHRHARRDACVILAAPAGDLLILVKRTAAPGATLARLAVAGDDGQGLSLRSRMRFSLVAALLIANANRPSQRGCGFAGIVPFD